MPLSDFFWGGFSRRWRKELGLPPDANPYYHYDLDWIVTVANMDPWIRPFETLKETAEEVVVKTGFGATMHKHFEFPMPEMRAWETDTFEKLERVDALTGSGTISNPYYQANSGIKADTLTVGANNGSGRLLPTPRAGCMADGLTTASESVAGRAGQTRRRHRKVVSHEPWATHNIGR